MSITDEFVNQLPFFTEVDPSAQIKGSRDPLGFQQIWTEFGRNVVGNLTTITTSSAQFMTLVLGYYFARQAAGEEEERFIEFFIKFEQMTAYSRYKYDPESRNDIRGINAVQTRVEESPGRLPLSADREGQILSNQKAYGVWGFFRVAGRDSGLLTENLSDLTPGARQFIDEVVLAESRARVLKGSVVPDILRKGRSFSPEGGHAEVARALAWAHSPAFRRDAGRTFLSRHLVLDEPDAPIKARFADGRQRRLWELIHRVNEEKMAGVTWDSPLGMKEFGLLCELAKDSDSKHETLAGHLDEIRRLEHLLAPAVKLYDFVLSHSGQTVSWMASEVVKVWPRGLGYLNVASLAPAIKQATGAEDASIRLLHLAEEFKAARYETAIELLVEHNADVMKRRGGGRWTDINRQDHRVEVRFSDDPDGELPEQDALPDLWEHSYFLEPIKRVGDDLLVRGVNHDE